MRRILIASLIFLTAGAASAKEIFIDGRPIASISDEELTTMQYSGRASKPLRDALSKERWRRYIGPNAMNIDPGYFADHKGSEQKRTRPRHRR